MEKLIIDNGLANDLYELTGEFPGDLDPSIDLAMHVQLDEGSDREDPMVTQANRMVTQANEISAVSDIVQLSRNMVELAELRRGQKRARSEDQGA